MSLFGRRVQHSWMWRLREKLWPTMGWQRALRYWRLRLPRLPGTVHGLSAGVASGVAMSFMPVGLHVVLAIGLALLTRGSLVAATLATLVLGNPLMITLLMAADLGLGEWLIADRARPLAAQADISLLSALQHPLLAMSHYGAAFLLGAAVLAGLAWLISYAMTRRVVQFAHARRAARLRQRPKRG
jgi:uncharacterized protein